MADIVLKDRNGRDVQYPGVNYLKVNTTDGGTQGFAAYDPETLKAENLPVGVTVGDVDGALEVPQLLENVPVALDFTNGDMEITAPDGYAIKSGIVQKPANLTPANIAKDVDIAGVVGTMEAGGGASGGPCIFLHATLRNKYYKSGDRDFSFSKTLPPGSVVINAIFSSGYAGSTSYSSSSSTATHRYYDYLDSITITETDTGVTVAASPNVSIGYSYNSLAASLVIIFYSPGFYIKRTDDGEAELYADETVTRYPTFTSLVEQPTTVDLSKSNISTLAGYSFFRMSGIKTIRLPATVTTIANYWIDRVLSLEELDFSNCTSVPTLDSTLGLNGISSSTTPNLQIKVPASLYDEWIAATNWSTYAWAIVAV